MKSKAAFVRGLYGLALVTLLVGCGSAHAVEPVGANVAPPFILQSGQTPADWIVFPIAGSVEDGLVAGPDGAMWFTQYNPSAISRITKGGTTTTYPVTGGPPITVILGPDGNFWFTMEQQEIGRITPSGQVTLIPMPRGQHGITTGPLQGAVRNLWFTAGQDKIFELTTEGHIKAKFSTPTQNSYPTAIITGPDGNLWFTEFGANKIGRMTPEGVFAEFPLPQGLQFGGFGGRIAVGKDGNIYTVEEAINTYSGKLIKITPAGVVTAIDLGDDQTEVVATGPDGNPWFYGTIHGLGLFSISKHAVFHLGLPPNELSTAAPPAIAAGPDGNVWLPVVTANGQDMDVFVR